MHEPLIIAGRSFHSRLFTGTGKFGNHPLMQEALVASGTELVTVAMKRVNMRAASYEPRATSGEEEDILDYIPSGEHFQLLPNTSGARTAKEAVFVAQLAREALGTPWIKL